MKSIILVVFIVLAGCATPQDPCAKIFDNPVNVNICRVEQNFAAGFISLDRQLGFAQEAGDAEKIADVIKRKERLSEAKKRFRAGTLYLSGDMPIDAVLDEVEKQLEKQL